MDVRRARDDELLMSLKTETESHKRAIGVVKDLKRRQ